MADINSSESHVAQDAMATPCETSADRDNPSNNDNDIPPSPFALNALINCDKELPPMPRPSLEEEPERTAYGDSGREGDFHRESSISWMDMDSGSESDDTDLEFLHSHRSLVLPPSLFSHNPATTDFIPRGGEQPSAETVFDESWSSTSSQQHRMPIRSQQHFEESPYIGFLPATAPHHIYNAHSPLLRSVSEGESSFLAESPPARSFARPPKASPSLPDPSQFPDPYPFRAPHHHLTSTPPALSSAGSSSASTRSSAYASSGSALASGDYGHVHVATGEEEETSVAVGITSDDVVQLMVSDSHASSSAFGSQSRVPIDQTRWSEYSASIRSRTSSVGPSNIEAAPRLTQKPSYDMGWQAVDERDEAGLSSEEEDDDHGLGDDLDDEDEEEKEEERTAAVVIAEEGRGLIMRGDGIPLVQLQVEPGTTHLLVGSSSTPNVMPSFLANTLPQICNTLLALDISANFLVAVPPALASCTCLEELNVASNPLRVLPVFLSHLTSLRVLIADSTGISTLPETFSELDKLHTLSVRRNKMNALPSWLCLLFSLQTLYVDGNPFQGPWKALVDPLLAKVPTTPMYPLSTPVFPLTSASLSATSADMETDMSDLSDPPTSDGQLAFSPEEDTITPERAPFLHATTAPLSMAGSEVRPTAARRGLTRTRTTPNRVAYNRARAANGTSMIDPKASGSAQRLLSKAVEDSGYFDGQRELRRMKSAGEIQGHIAPEASADPRHPPTPRPSTTQYGSSASSSNLLSVQPDPDLIIPPRFASLGISHSPSRSASGSRPTLTQSLWDNTSEHKDDPASSPEFRRTPSLKSPNTPARNFMWEQRQSHAEHSPAERHSIIRSKDGKDKGDKAGKWGFFRKMSMGKMRIDSPSSSGRATPMNISRPSAEPMTLFGGVEKPEPPARPVHSPRIDMRISTTGALGNITIDPAFVVSPPTIKRKSSNNALTAPTTLPSSSNLLAPSSSPTPRAAKRRSFLPIDTPLPLNIPMPSAFISGLTASNEDDDDSKKSLSPVIDTAEHCRREEEKLREASTRALRSVMAYLKDMNDLNQTQNPSTGIYGSPIDEGSSSVPRSRRPTIVDRNVSDGSISRSGSSGQLRSEESIAGLRNGSTAQTMSVATTDSNGSGEERKFKDDKAKRAMVVREIVETERTYVKGLAELVDLYIKPGAAPVNLLSGVGSSKDTVVPAAERKIVFNGLDALFSFHKESFLPALEVAAAPLMKPARTVQEADSDGQLSLNVVKAVASMFIKHAAFMKMYSSYINNFDNSLQRVKYWSSDRLAPGKEGSPSPLSPTSSTAQLVGLGLSMSTISNPGITDAGSPSSNGMTNLTTSQKKRIKTYLKRCRMSPRHSQLNLEGYLLLPVQRIPRYRLLLEELLRSTPPSDGYIEDPLDKALAEISSLANSMNEGKRESESRRKLVQWQSRIRGRFPSPLVQPHRRLIMDGPLLLTRVVRKAVVSFEAFNALGDASTVQVDCLAPELTPRALVGILCNDLLVLCRDPSEGKDVTSPVDLWAVLRMQTLPQPASIVHGNALRLVDNKAILYFDAPSPSDALNWFRAINLHIPDSKT